MKFNLTLFILFLILISASNSQAQINFPPASPEAHIQEQVGFTKIHIHYERPAARGRKIFGALVPFNELWRTGAGDATTLKFSEEVLLGDSKIPKGKYSLFSIPTATDWTIVLNKDTTLHGTGSYKQENDVARFQAKPEPAGRYYENFTIAVSDVVKNNGVLYLIWENTQVKIPIITNADEKIMTEIQQKVVTEKGDSPVLLYQVANYYFENGKDLPTALVWIKKATAQEENMMYYHLQAKIQAKTGDYKSAIVSAGKSATLAKEKKNADLVKKNEELVAEWSKKNSTR